MTIEKIGFRCVHCSEYIEMNTKTGELVHKCSMVTTKGVEMVRGCIECDNSTGCDNSTWCNNCAYCIYCCDLTSVKSDKPKGG